MEITWRNVDKTDSLDRLIRTKVERLRRVCGHLSSCRVAIEKPQHERVGVPYRVRITMTVPPSHEIVVTRNPGEGRPHEALPAVVRQAFEAAQRRLKRLTERQQGKTKNHKAESDATGVVTKLFRDQGYGFLRTLEGQEIYFHRHSVANDDFDRLEIGTGVRFVPSLGRDGPQASKLHIINKPGARASAEGVGPSQPPTGW